MKYRVDYGELLALLSDTFELFTRRDVGWILAGYRGFHNERDTYVILRKLTQQELIAQRGKGKSAQFVVSDAGRRRSRVARPSDQWNRRWDGRWRAVTYDLPEVRRKERQSLWSALRDRRLGLLQRSVWIWPHPLEDILQEIITVEGVPECFCGLDADRLFLCTHAEVVATAWDWEEIAHRHRSYLNNTKATPAQAKAAALPALAHLLRLESAAYQYAFSLDPLLPRTLWPAEYDGPAVERRHAEFVAATRQRWHQLASG
jgi:DNA-binding transcriptional regulator PaaX